MPTASLRLALLATAFALPGVVLAQAPAPSAAQAPAASVPPKGASAPSMSKSANPPATNAAKASAAPAGAASSAAPSAPATAAPAAQASGDANARGGKKSKSSKSATGAPGATGTANAVPAAANGSPPPKSARAKEGTSGGKTVGMQRAFADLQTTGEFNTYRDKAQAVKTVDECRSLMEDTRKQLESRAKAQNKPINVDIDKACATAKERKGLTG